ncbi:MAG TPA: glutaminyl-peptide cyclotransferase [Gammaproteobacteria bacterium]|nr:glutaminyl-peptide cyclotransferase [Gammaproteobacteria bacterium]
MWFALCGPVACSSGSPPPLVRQYSYTIVKSHPHSADDFTQGLVFMDGRLYESTGLYGRSAVSIKSLDTGGVIKRFPLPDRYFGEGLAAVGERLVQITYRENTGFVYDRAKLQVLQEFSYPGEGWGLAYDGVNLIMSDGSARLYFLDPSSFSRNRILTVSRMGDVVTNLNELEYARNRIYANVWQRNLIVEIDPVTGYVTGEVDLTELAQRHTVSPDAVLNGIAYDSRNDVFLVTGKLWPALYEIKLHNPDP